MPTPEAVPSQAPHTFARRAPAPSVDAGAPHARLVGDEGIWFFIAGDLCLFGLCFLLFMTARVQAPAEFELSREVLDAGLGLVNTVVLVSSSCFMARAVVASRHQVRAAVVRNLGWTMCIGSVFALVKAVEYGSDFRAGISPVTNDFFMYYFALTGLHLLHYLGGMVALGVTTVRARTRELDAGSVRWIESVGVYWHMVDLIWIFLFPTFYLLSAT